MGVFKVQDLVLHPTIGTSVELRYIEKISTNKYQQFEGMTMQTTVLYVGEATINYGQMIVFPLCFIRRLHPVLCFVP